MSGVSSQRKYIRRDGNTFSMMVLVVANGGGITVSPVGGAVQ